MSQAQREWFEKDYYAVLGVSESATEKDITRAYRKLAKQYHPDANPGAEDRFKEISAAYDVLGDAQKRKEYDEIRRMGPMSGVFGQGPGGFTTNFRVEDINDLFGGLFGRVRQRGGRPSAGATGPRRGKDLEAELHLSFQDAMNGVTTAVNVTSDAPCSTCSGTGAAPGTSPIVCPECAGRGVRDENQGFFSFSQVCRGCNGTGMKLEHPCPACQGSGLEVRPRQVRVRIPPGVANGQRIRVKGRGGAGANGGPAGDLYVLVHVGIHALFGRRGKNLTLSVPVTFPEAALGSEIKVPTLSNPVTLRIPPGTKSGRVLRVKGYGVPQSNGSAGDLLVTIDVDVPEQVTDAQREAIEALARTTDESPRRHLGV